MTSRLYVLDSIIWEIGALVPNLSRLSRVFLILVSACGQARQPAAADLAEARRELEARGKTDQAVREGLSTSDEPDIARIHQMQSVDSANSAWLEAWVERWGWPTTAQVGQEAVDAAFLIVQHAVHDTAFMREMLPHIEAAHARGDYDGQRVALLTDRLEVKAGRPQIYGTQLSVRDGKLVLDPIRDSAGVDDRRRRMGMMPLAEYLRRADSAFRSP